MQHTDIIVIGAGATGLMAAMQLVRNGKKVTVLEARDRAGGRIYTDNQFNHTTELGAEFVHGALPVTLALLKDAKIKALNAVGDMWQYRDGEFSKSGEFLAHYDTVIKKMNALKRDITLDKFLAKHLNTKKYIETCTALRNFAAGYDTADPTRFSIFAMRSELQSEDDEHQYRVEGGYIAMINYLQKQVLSKGGAIHLSTVVKELKWKRNKVTVVTDNRLEFTADKVIVAMPLGVLQANQNHQGAITFLPPLPKQEKALQQLGMGAIIKLLLQFDEAFWDEQAKQKGATADIEQMSYLFSNEPVPTWWVQKPHTIPLLTGWLGGPDAYKLKNVPDDDILAMGLQSLSAIYDVPVPQLRGKLTAHKIMNWTADPFTLGSYSYATVSTDKARKLLSKPLQNTIYFAGEFMYDGPEMGTVEAALASGKQVALNMIANL